MLSGCALFSLLLLLVPRTPVVWSDLLLLLLLLLPMALYGPVRKSIQILRDPHNRPVSSFADEDEYPVYRWRHGVLSVSESMPGVEVEALSSQALSWRTWVHTPLEAAAAVVIVAGASVMMLLPWNTAPGVLGRLLLVVVTSCISFLLLRAAEVLLESVFEEGWCRHTCNLEEAVYQDLFGPQEVFVHVPAEAGSGCREDVQLLDPRIGSPWKEMTPHGLLVLCMHLALALEKEASPAPTSSLGGSPGFLVMDPFRKGSSSTDTSPSSLESALPHEQALSKDSYVIYGGTVRELGSGSFYPAEGLEKWLLSEWSKAPDASAQPLCSSKE